ncbi:PspC domain-containing protein [Occultella gossypii]|uniref:PspC domain-containing protein n=1 Tax=Occultella gossypii TaxID=2800820 RepID=A0ABS7SBI8_9MICO|nr:PspC domain-containing protein [Occultella gossypii]MBZ2197721.1 PspC domain-containing protein [Occultella gossypii]
MSTDNSAGPPPAPPAPGQSSTDAFFDSLRRTRMPRTTDRWIGGVAAGVARRLNIDPLIVRGVLVVMTLFGGLGLFLYGIGWALLPEETDGRIHLQEAIRGRFDAALAGAIAFALVGASRLGFWWDNMWWGGEFFGTILVLGAIALVIWLIVVAQRSGKGRTSQPPSQPAGAVPPVPAAPGPSTGPTGAPTTSWPSTTGPANPVNGAPGQSADHGPATWANAAAPSEVQPATGTTPAGENDPALGDTGPAFGAGEHGTGGTDPVSVAGASTAGWSGRVEPTYTAANGGNSATYGSPSGPEYPAVPAAAWTPTPAPRRAPVPARPSTPGPGKALTRIVFGLSLVTIAGLWLLDYVGGVAVGGWLTGVGVVLVLFGIGVLVAGLLGRRSGVIGGLAVLIALVGVPWAAVEGSTNFGDFNWTESGSYGDARWVPQDAAELEGGFDDIAGGEVTVDLTELEGSVRLGEPVQLGLGAGQLNLRVPEGMSVQIQAQVLGEVVARTSDGWEGGFADDPARPIENNQWRTSPSRGVVLISPAGQVGEPDLTIVIDAGVGEIRIIEESA